MRIRRVVSTRYKALPEGLTLEFAERGLQPIVGPNEAGKSSVLDLIRRVLFAEARNGFEDGVGGRVELTLADGAELTVERYGRRPVHVRDREGRAWTTSQLEDRLAATAGLFRNIYGFGLAELEQLDTLEKDHVGTQLVSAGLGLRVNLGDVLDRLKKQADELYRERGHKPPLNAALNDMRRLAERIQAQEAQQSHYAQLTEELAAWEEEGERRAQEARRREAELARLQQMYAVWPKWVQLKGLQQEMAALAHAAAVPEEAGPRLAMWQERLDHDRRRLDDLTERAREQERQLPEPTRLMALESEAMAGVMERAASITQWMTEEHQHRGRVEELASAVEAEAKRLGLSLPRLREGIPAKLLAPRVSRLGQELAQAAAGVDQQQQLVDERARQVENAGAALEALADVPRRGAWEARRAQLKMLADAPRRGTHYGSALLWLLALVAALTAAVTGRHPVAVLSAGVAAAAAAVGLGLVLAERRRTAARDLAEAGLASPLGVAAAQAEWEQLAARVAEHEALEARLAQARRELDAAKDELVRARERLDVAQAAWQAFLADEGLPALSPPEMLAWLAEVEGALAQVARWERAEEALRQVQETEREFLRYAHQTAVQVGLEVRERGSLNSWTALRGEWQEVPDIRRRWSQAMQLVEEAVGKVRESEAGLQAFLATLGVATVAQATRLTEEAARLRFLQREALRLDAELSAQSGGQGLDAYRQWDGRGIEVGLQEAQDACDGARARRRDAENQAAARREQLKELERSGTLAELRLELEARRQAAAQLYHRWAVRRLAADVLHLAHERFQRERQPEVLQAASKLFDRFTAGRYVRVMAAGDSIKTVSVERGDGALFSPPELSRGTREQLYLALRLAWIESRERQAEPLPLIFDDVLVNSDPVRQKEMARILAALGRRRQLIYLTCHPEMSKLLKQAGAAPALSLA